MYLNAVSHYIPSGRRTNKEIEQLNGMDNETIIRKTGIVERSKAAEGENTNTMALKAIDILQSQNQVKLNNTDLIIGGSYTPYDTVGTIAHVVQAEYNLTDSRALYVSSACSSFINAVEVVEGYFCTGKSKNALVVMSEHNSAYNDETNPVSGHLWGDGSGAVTISKDKTDDSLFEIIDIQSKGHGDVGKGPEGVYNRVGEDGLIMPDGRNVFQNACTFMANASEEILKRNGYSTDDLDHFIPHQANIRIIDYVVTELGINRDICITNIDRLGNTGCASTVIALSENMDRIKKDDLVLIAVFGGGYSSGSMLLKRL